MGSEHPVGSCLLHVFSGPDHHIDQIVYSAPYPGEPGQRQSGYFREWRLEQPCDILQVYLLIRNIDMWTVGKFQHRVLTGIQGLANAVKTEKQGYCTGLMSRKVDHDLFRPFPFPFPWAISGLEMLDNASVLTEIFSFFCLEDNAGFRFPTLFHGSMVPRGLVLLPHVRAGHGAGWDS